MQSGSPAHRGKQTFAVDRKPVDPHALPLPSAALAEAVDTSSRLFDHRLRDNDVICLFQPTRNVYWKCEEVTLGSGCAIKLRANLGEHGLYPGNKFEVIMAPPHAPVDGVEQRPRFALKSLHNGRLVSPNFRGRFHVDVEHDDVKETIMNNTFEAVHKTYGELTARAARSHRFDKKKLEQEFASHDPTRPAAQAVFWFPRLKKWTMLHDSSLHTDARVALGGDAKRMRRATPWTIILLSRGARPADDAEEEVLFEESASSTLAAAAASEASEEGGGSGSGSAALPLAPPSAGELILFTVTFCANPAHHLTRSPSYVFIFNYRGLLVAASGGGYPLKCVAAHAATGACAEGRVAARRSACSSLGSGAGGPRGGVAQVYSSRAVARVLPET